MGRARTRGRSTLFSSSHLLTGVVRTGRSSLSTSTDLRSAVRAALSSSDMSTDVQTPAVRVDKWLWCARFFKSRAQATQAVVGGLIHINRERCKPSRLVHVGDQVEITKGDTTFIVVVRAIPSRRGPASEARLCFEETPESIAAREQRRARALTAPAPVGRPDKHERRALRDLRRR
jgi:ribosome-associated heat shock protein Hsp15